MATWREDAWWVGPVLTCLGFTGFIIYSTWAAFQGDHYWIDGGSAGFGGYLSPFYSPVVYVKLGVNGAVPMHHALLGSWPAWWPSFLPPSPAFFILAFPGAFRFTCYYYRKAYYRAFAVTPPGCGVGAVPQAKYKGETALMVFQNLHRYAMYFAVVFIFILGYDAIQGFFRGGKFFVGVGSFVLLINVVLLACYTFGCHSWRHLAGGRLNCFSCDGLSKARHGAWHKISWLNSHHMLFAWVSLFWVGFTDIYVRLVSHGVFTDFVIWGS